MTREPKPLPPSLLTAEALIAWRGRPTGAVPGAVILTHQESLFSALAPRLRTRLLKGFFPDLVVAPGTSDRLAVAGGIGVGGPATAMAVEELAVAGVQRIVMVDVAAGLSLRDEGRLLVATEALATDGTSRHYLGAEAEEIGANTALLARVDIALRGATGVTQPVMSGRVASTDAPFRETAALLQSFRVRDALAVDMETAAFYAAAAALGIDAAAVLVIGDSLDEQGWRPPRDRESIRRQLLRVAEIVRQVLLE